MLWIVGMLLLCVYIGNGPSSRRRHPAWPVELMQSESHHFCAQMGKETSEGIREYSASTWCIGPKETARRGFKVISCGRETTPTGPGVTASGHT